MRYELIRYASEYTGWDVHFALRHRDTHMLVTGKDNSPVKPFTFKYPIDAIRWVKGYTVKGSSIEWEGSTF